LGTLTYAYDLAGQRTQVGGSWARTVPPQPVASATYDAANRVISWDGTPLSYDPNGNLIVKWLRSFTWNDRDQLAGVTARWRRRSPAMPPPAAPRNSAPVPRRRSITIRASTEEVNCLRKKLKDNCDANCKVTIEARIKQMEQFRDSFR
jgi:hypothetical protein